MQIFSDFFKALSTIFRVTAKATAPLELLIEQTAFSLVDSHAEAKAKAAIAPSKYNTQYGATDAQLAALDKQLWG